MSPRVLVFVEDPGAANGIVSVPSSLAARGIDTRVVAAEPAATFLVGKLDTFDRADSSTTAQGLLDAHRPDLVLVGTSENPATLGLALVDAARARRIRTTGFVDAFPNAAYRFRGATDDPLAHFPDTVLVPDEWTKQAFVDLGASLDRVLVTGHPGYDTVLASGVALEREGRDRVRSRALPKAPAGARVLTFTAEISTGFDAAQFQRSEAYTLHGRGGRNGRTQIVLEELLDAARALSPRPHLVLRLHPKNVRDEFAGLLEEVDEVSAGGPALEVVYASDLVVGMTSTILIEAALLARPTLAIVPRPLERDWLPTIRAGITPCATTREAIRDHLASWFAGSWPPVSPFAETGALRRISDVLGTLARKPS